MSSFVELMAEVSATCYSIGSCHWVEVTHINRPDDFYVRPIAYTSHLRMLEAFEGPVEESRLKPGSVLVYKSPIRKGYVRGRILSIRHKEENKVCIMFALDYGFIESVSADCLRSPKGEGMPALSVHCQLELQLFCQSRGREYNKKAMEAMLFYKSDEVAKMIVKGHTEDKRIVKLIKFHCANNFTLRLYILEQPKLVFSYKKVHVGDCIPVRVQSGHSLQSFYVADISDFRTYIAELTDLPTYLRLETEMRPEDVKAGKPVAVQNAFKYERAVIKKVSVPEKKAIVQLVDFGKIIEIDLLRNRLKELGRDCYFLRPALAMYCSTDDKQAWDHGKPTFLYPGLEFVITVLKVGRNLETPNIVNLTRILK